ncbi:MAG TPA: dihydrodipicolinate reductase C-terminal domain-containing protein [Candidatus Baltobacteraceae bacterium]|jgi:4-hydroxy-tetrahydrodipicolinate reductase
MTPVRVGVAGALGRMGRVTCAAVESSEDMELVARFSRGDDLQTFLAQKPDVVVDFTVYPISRQVAGEAIRAGARVVVGATGWPEADVISFRDAVENAKLGALIVPNFAIGAVLLMRLAEIAAPHFRGVEIIEMHHDQKKDKPSGTARLTAERIEFVAPALGKVPIHSIRLSGLVAHQSVLFGAPGQTLEIRHDSLARESFADGILLAIRDVMKRRGLRIGLDSVLFSEASP